MKFSHLRFRIHLSRAIGIAALLESLLLIPGEAWSGAGPTSYTYSQLNQRAGKTPCVDTPKRATYSVTYFRIALQNEYYSCPTPTAANRQAFSACLKYTSFASLQADSPTCATKLGEFVSLQNTKISSTGSSTSSASGSAVGSTASGTARGTASGTASGTANSTAKSAKPSGKPVTQTDKTALANTKTDGAKTATKTADAKGSRDVANEKGGTAIDALSGATAKLKDEKSSDRKSEGAGKSPSTTAQNSSPAATPSSAPSAETGRALTASDRIEKIADRPGYVVAKSATGATLGIYKASTTVGGKTVYDYDSKTTGELDERSVKLDNGQILKTNSDGLYSVHDAPKGGSPEEIAMVEKADATNRTRLKEINDKRKAAQANKKTYDPCYDSTVVGGEAWGCKKTQTAVKKAEVVNMIGQAGGSAVITQLGNAGAQRAAQTGLLSDTHAEAAKAAKQAAMIQGVLGVANLMSSSSLKKKVNLHGEHQAALNTAPEGAASGTYQVAANNVDKAGIRVYSNDEMSQKIIDEFGMNERAGLMGANAKLNQVASDSDKKRKSILNEQTTAKMSAATAKVAADMEAAKQLTQAASSAFTAMQLAKTAKLAAEAEGKAGAIAQPNFGIDPADLKAQMAAGAAAATAGNSATTGDETTETASYDTNLKLEDGAGDPSPGGGPAKLTPGAYIPNSGGGGSGGGGGGMGGGGGSAPPAPNQDEGKAQYAANFEGKDKYEGTGTTTKGGGGSRGGADGDGGGIDFNSLLAKFLPSDEDKQSPSVLETNFGGSRDIAAVNSAPSFLDAKTDIFVRLHEFYQDKQARGHVGTTRN